MRLCLVSVLIILSAALIAPAAQADADRVLRVSASEQQPILPVRVNGVSMRLILAPNGPRAVILNGDAADRAGVRANPILSSGVSFSVGGETLRGRTGRTGINIEQGPRFRQRVIWFPDTQFTPEADGYIGAAALRNLDQLSIQLTPVEDTIGAQVQPVRFEAERGFAWRARVDAEPQPFLIEFSLIQDTQLTARGARLLERSGLIAGRDDQLRMTRLWFIRDSLAFNHENLGLSIAGLRPQGFARFATTREVEAHRDRLAFEAEHGSIETITVRATARGDDDAPIKITLGRDFLRNCRQIEFDYSTDAITAHCPVETSEEPS